MFGFGYGRSFSLGRISLVADIYKGLLDLYPGAAAAYSLRWLNTSYTGSAVEVSRDVDTQVQDIGFTANGSLDSTALLEFATNSSQSLLDYATGSAAAYSLRKVTSDSPVTTLPANFGSGAAAAYSLRKVNANYTGSAIEVRRSSDDTTQDIGFDANGDLDTTALDAFVNEEITIATSDFSGATPSPNFAKSNVSLSSSQSVLGVDDALKITLSGGASSHYVYAAGITIGQEYKITFDYYIPSGQTLDYVRAGVGSPETTFDTTGEWVTGASFTQVAGQVFYIFRFTSSAADGDVFYIKNIVVTQTTADGAVRTWYDQSGNNNDASNGTDTEQPLIVDGGTLVTENSKAAVEFDGVDDTLSTTLASSISQPFSGFFVSKENNASDAIIGSKTATSGNRLAFYQYGGNYTIFNGTNGASTLSGTLNQKLISFLANSPNGYIALDGVLSGGINSGGEGLVDFRISGYFNSPVNQELDGTVQEVILFPSDQSANRTDIEWEINNYYNIYPQWDRQSAIEVRRSSDDAVQDIGFDANGDLDTTALTTFVNADVNVYTSDFSFTEDLGEFNGSGSAAQSVGGVDDAYKFTLSGGNVVHFVTLFLPEFNQTYSVTLDYYIPSGQTVTDIEASLGSTSQHTLDVTGAWTTETFTFVASDDSSPNNKRIRFVTNTYTNVNADGDVFYLKNIVVTQTTADGAVRTWYDQSGEGNDALNGTDTEQPLIVDAGTVVTQSNRPAIDFDGVDDVLVNSTYSYSGTDIPFSIIYAGSFVNDSSNQRLVIIGTLSTNFSGINGVLNTISFNGSSGVGDNKNQTIATGTFNGTQNVVEIYSDGVNGIGALNGSAVVLDTDYVNAINYSGISIGGFPTFSFSKMKGQEIIIYSSDQSSNRLGIESNINAYYDIYTNPSASAYVRTWYDQSGNTNDAIQTSESARPKIVNTGSLVLENGKLAIDFDGVNDYLDLTGINIAASNYTFLFVLNAAVENSHLFDTLVGRIVLDNGSYAFYDGATKGSSFAHTGTQNLAGFYLNTSGSNVYLDGSLNQSSLTYTQRAIGGSTALFARYDGAQKFVDGTIQEFILFNSDQSSNRPFIERLINNQFNIFTEAAPTITGAPTISGDVQLGSTLTASTSATVTGTPTPVTTWRWEKSTNGTSGWTVIIGETTTTYDIQDGDLGYYLRVVQIESNGVGTATSPSTSTDVVRTISGAFVARVVADGGEVENESAGTTQVEYLSNNP